MEKKIQQHQIDKMSDVIWWFYGYRSNMKEFDECRVDESHIRAMADIRSWLMEYNDNA